MKSRFYKAMAIGVAVIALASCEKEEIEDPTPTPTQGEFHVEMNYVWAMSQDPFVLNQTYYHPMTGDSLNYSTFKHYISNVKLKRADGTYWVAEESYHLLDASDPTSLDLHFTNVPSGNYSAIEITFGVDSARNVSGAQTGALDPANNMFWSWNSGYIMIKAEGTSPQSGSGIFAYHLGGFSGRNTAIAVRELSFPNSEVLSISTSTSPVISMLANPARIFHTYGSVSNGETLHMPGETAGEMAQDFNTWARVDHIHP